MGAFAHEHRPMHLTRKAGVVRGFASCYCSHCRYHHYRSYPVLIPTTAPAMQLPSPSPPSPLLLSQSFCGCITVVLSSGVAAITTATMGTPVNFADSPTVRASPAISAAYAALPANTILSPHLLAPSPLCPLPTTLPFTLPLPEPLLYLLTSL
jgi:hypothetical protein